MDGQQGSHEHEHLTRFLIDSMDTNDMDTRADGEEDGGADGLKQEKVLASLQMATIESSVRGRITLRLTSSDQFVSKKATPTIVNSMGMNHRRKW